MMHRLRAHYIKQYQNNISVLLIAGIFIGLYTSRALISIGVALLFVNTLVNFDFSKLISIRKETLAILAITLLFFADFISGIYSSDISQWASFVWRKLPLLLIPISMIQLQLEKKKVYFLFSLFFIFTILSALVVLYNYAANSDHYHYLLSLGQTISMPHNHIRYSIMLAFAVIIGIHLFSKNIFNQWKWEVYVWAIGSLFLFITIHVISVRTGIVGLYLALICYGFLHFTKKKKWFYGILVIAGLSALPYIAYKTLPSFKNKIDYMSWDINQFKKGKINHESDARRIRSYEIGWYIGKDYFPLGTGVGDYKLVVNDYYEMYYPNTLPNDRILPHNQFIWTLGSSGILGLLLVCAVLFILFFYCPSGMLMISFLAIIGVSLFIDTPFDDQIGIVFTSLIGALIIREKSMQE